MPPTPAVRNANPGNIKDPATGTFRKFSNPGEGGAALLNDLRAKQTGTTTTGLGPSSTLVDFAEKWAPASDGNNPGQYAANLANYMGVSPAAQLKDLNLGKWAEAITLAEDKDAAALMGVTPRGSAPIPYTPLNVPETEQDEYKGVLEQQPVLGALGEKLSGRVQDIADTFQQPSLARGLLRSAGAVAGGIGDVTGAAISAVTPDFIEKPITEGIGKFVAGIPGVKEGAEAYGRLDPELQKDLGAIGNIASLIPIGKGAALGVGASKGLVPGVVRTASKAEGVVGDVARRSLIREAAEIVSPKQTAKVSKTGIKSGRGEKSGLLGEISITPDARTQRAAEAAAGIVKKGNTMTENANALRSEIGKTAEQLKDDLAKMEVVPLVQKEEMDDLLNRALQEIGENPTMVGDAGKSAELILKKFQSFLPKGDVTALDLLEARKKLDTWMDSLQAGNVFNPNYESAKTVALRAIRQGVNDLVALKAPNIPVKESLARQTALFDALENVSQKAASEVGTNVLDRFGKKHPGIRGLINMTGQGLGIGTGINLLD